MPFQIKTQKDKAYFKRFQVKFRRRRQGKTDYKARKNLIKQDKNKYNIPKYRFVVRFTNTDIICQVVAAKIVGDQVLTAAYAHELKNYGVKAGYTNYAAAYCVGLLTARRLLKKLGLDAKFKGAKEATGKFYLIRKLTYKQKKRILKKGMKLRKKKHPFTALLDVGLHKTSTGARVFAALKGACDGGLSIPHNPKRFAGFSKEQQKLDPEALRNRIFAAHVAEWMKKLKLQDEKKFQKQFGKYVAAGVGADDIQAMYANAHKAIRANPEHQKKAAKPKPEKQKRWGRKKFNQAQRKDRVRQKLASFQKKKAANVNN